MMDDVLTTRQQLRFNELARVRVPHRYLLIDELLDLVGRRLFPEFWGAQPLFNRLPFKMSKPDFEEGSVLSAGEDDIPLLNDVMQDQAEYVDLSNLGKQFWRICRQVESAYDRRKFKLHFFDEVMGISRDRLPEGVLQAQECFIFYTGRGYPPGHISGRPAVPIVGERRSVEGWLCTEAFRDNNDHDLPPPLTVARVIPSSVASAVSQFLVDRQLRVSKQFLWRAFEGSYSVHSRPFNEHSYTRDIWRAEGVVPVDLRLTGRPTSAVAVRLEESRQELTDVIQRAYESATRPKA